MLLGYLRHLEEDGAYLTLPIFLDRQRAKCLVEQFGHSLQQVFLALDVVVERAGLHPQGGCETTHVYRVQAVSVDDRQGRLADVLASKWLFCGLESRRLHVRLPGARVI